MYAPRCDSNSYFVGCHYPVGCPERAGEAHRSCENVEERHRDVREEPARPCTMSSELESKPELARERGDERGPNSSKNRKTAIASAYGAKKATDGSHTAARSERSGWG
jgi:hypothetical protein